MALVLTLMAVSFLVAITVQLTTSVNWQMQGAGNLRDSVQLDAISRSGLSLARAALLADLKKNNFDSEHDSWGVKLTEDAPALFGQGKLKVEVTDLSGKLQVNALVPDKNQKKKQKGQTNLKQQQNTQINLWKRFLNSDKFEVADSDEVEKLIYAIIDWIDEDDDEKINGAEKGYYRSLSPSYKPRNAPIMYLEELLLIRGMTKELFYGNDEKFALKDYLTVAGRQGSININSVRQELLLALDPLGNMSEQAANDMIEFRQDEDNKAILGNLNWYKSFSGSELEPDLVTVKSNYFKVVVEATHENMTRTGTGILERVEGKDEQILKYWEVR
jgi:general secretion pathway protein K